MIRQDPQRRLMKEMMGVALDVQSRMSGILAAMKEKPALFDKVLVYGMRDFAKEGLLQRGGGVSNAPVSNSTQQVADDFLSTCSKVDTLSAKLRRGRFARNPLVVAGLSIRTSDD